MNFSRLKALWEKYRTLRVFNSVFGMSFALLILVVLVGMPHVAHASLGSVVWGWVTDIVGKVADATFGAIFMAVGYVVLGIANFLLFVIGVLFNYVIVYTVFQFGDYFGNSAGLLAAWGILRDVANIMLIFGFVMLGMATVLDIHGYEVKKTLPRLIIFAILMNFSLLASEAVIDTANAFASVFYTQASTQCSGSDSTCATQGTNGGISAEIFKLSGLTTVFSQSSNASANDDQSYTHWGITYLGMAIFVTILCVVLLAGVVMLVSRAIVLAVLMVLSPLGFAGLAIPPLEKYALDWWHRLLAQAFFAPVYLLFIFVAMKMVQGMSSGNVDIESAIANGTTSALGSVAIFAVLIGFLVMALITAKNMGAAGASIATKAAGSAVVGGTAFIGRRTVGRGSSWAADRLNNSKFGRSRTGQMLISGFNYGAKSSFDARGMGKIGSLDLGKAGGKDGYTGELHKKEEARKKAGEKLALTKDEQKNISDTKTAQAALAKEMADRHKEAQAPGQATIADLRAQIKNAPEGSKEREALVQELRSEQEALRTLREEQNAERTTMEAAHKEKLQKLEDAPQREYAEKLTVAPRFSTPGLNVLNPILKVRYKVGISGDADRHTAKTMLKNLKKTPEQRTADKSNKEILDAIHKMGHGGGGDHGGGGGGGGAPKAASGGGGDHH